MLSRRVWWIPFMKTFVRFKCKIEMDSEFFYGRTYSYEWRTIIILKDFMYAGTKHVQDF